MPFGIVFSLKRTSCLEKAKVGSACRLPAKARTTKQNQARGSFHIVCPSMDAKDITITNGFKTVTAEKS